MWDQSGLGLQPQYLHFTIICCLGVTPNSCKIPKAWSTQAAVMCWGHIHMPWHHSAGDLYIKPETYRFGSCPSIPFHFFGRKRCIHYQSPICLSFKVRIWEFSENDHKRSRLLLGTSSGGRYTSICTSTAYKGCQTPLYIYHWCEMNMGWVCSLTHRISPSLIAWE